MTYGGRRASASPGQAGGGCKSLTQMHKTLEEFFLLIGLTPGEAFREAEKLEHVISLEMVRRIEKLNEVLKKLRGF